MAKNRALTLKKAHQRREKIQSALLDKTDYLYIKDIADLCSMQTVDISNDLKEMTRLGLLSKKEDKTAHPKRLMYKLKPVMAARLSKASKTVSKKESAKPVEHSPTETSTSKAVGKPVVKTAQNDVVATKLPTAKSSASKNGKSAPSKLTSEKVAEGKIVVAKKSDSVKARPSSTLAPKSASKASKPDAKPSKPVAKPSSKSPAVKAGKPEKKPTPAQPVKSASGAGKAQAEPKLATTPTAAAPTPKKSHSPTVVAVSRKRAPSGATQSQILAELAKGEALSIEALCLRLNKQTANMYKMVGSLHAQGQIQKQKGPGRGFVYSLSGSVPVLSSLKAKPAASSKSGSASEAELLDHLIDKLAGAAKVFLRRLINA